jgi:penicillin-binding protein 1A
MVFAGVDSVIATAHSLGITSDLAANANTAIGTSAVPMVDLAAAYGAFADGGTRVLPRTILRVTSADGGVLYDAGTPRTGERVLDASVTQSITSILLDYAAHWGVSFDRPVASKSGTTDGSVDAWYVAYAPRWVVTAWVGHTDGSSPNEVGMNGVGGNDVGRDVVAPFVATLPAGDDGFAGRPPPAPSPGGDQGAQGGD